MPPTPADAGGEERPRRRSAILVALDDRGRVLLVRQGGGFFAGEWLLPGGGLEPGESAEDAVRREVLEETGLTVTDASEIARYDVRFGDGGGDVTMFGGSVAGEIRVGAAGEPVRWAAVDRRGAHPVLLRELRDAGVMDATDEEIDVRAAALGVRIARTG